MTESEEFPLILARFVTNHNGLGQDAEYKVGLRDAFVNSWIWQERDKGGQINHDTFKAYLNSEIPDYQKSNFISQLLNAFDKCVSNCGEEVSAGETRAPRNGRDWRPPRVRPSGRGSKGQGNDVSVSGPLTEE